VESRLSLAKKGETMISMKDRRIKQHLTIHNRRKTDKAVQEEDTDSGLSGALVTSALVGGFSLPTVEDTPASDPTPVEPSFSGFEGGESGGGGASGSWSDDGGSSSSSSDS
jgi:uncharacterized membrane protein YgcG